MKICIVLILILSLCVTLSFCDEVANVSEGEVEVFLNKNMSIVFTPDEHFLPTIGYLILGCLMLLWSSFKIGNMMDNFYEGLSKTHTELPALFPLLVMLISTFGSLWIADLHFFSHLVNVLIFIISMTFFNYNFIFLHSEENKFRSVVIYVLLNLCAVFVYILSIRYNKYSPSNGVLGLTLFIIIWVAMPMRQYFILFSGRTIATVDEEKDTSTVLVVDDTLKH